MNKDQRERNKKSAVHRNAAEEKRQIGHNVRHASYDKDHIFWCPSCNVPLIGESCTCGQRTDRLVLSQPADPRFCSPYEREVLHKCLLHDLACDPLEERIVLLNKIPGDDRTDEVIVDGIYFGILSFDIRSMDYRFEPMLQGARILAEFSEKKRVLLKKSSMHLNGKKIDAAMVESMSPDIRAGDTVLIIAGSLFGYGTSYCNAGDLQACTGPALRVRKIDSRPVSLNPRIASMEEVIAANIGHLRSLGKNAINTIKGIANQHEHKDLPVHVSFSGGKDSLVVLDLTLSALRNRDVKAFFLNTGIEFPETLEFVHEYCADANIELIEKQAGNSFWENVDSFGPPAKDFRWCCKICKLASANEAIEQCLENAPICLTIDGKRKHESFSRARIAVSERNPFVPSQLNIFPIKAGEPLKYGYTYTGGV